MQLLEIVLYHRDGRIRRVDFEPGALNIVTGESKAGKSALLTIVEYCLGRSSMLVPVGPISDTVAWYAALWQLSDGRAFVARPAPAPGRASSSQAMLEFGTDMQPLALAQLQTNIDVAALREQLGRRIGIAENLSEPGPGSLRQALEANIGHAALLCLQGQNEIASPTALFHRQSEQGMDNALRDTIPYFVGAVARDEARKRAQLRDARRTLSRVTAELERAEEAALTVEVELSALFTEARVVGLVDDVEVPDRASLVRLLQAARSAPSPTLTADARTQDSYRQLRDTRDQLRTQLTDLTRDRGLLLDEAQAASGATGALEQQEGRLNVLTRLPAPAASAVSDTAHSTAPRGARSVSAHTVDTAGDASSGAPTTGGDGGADGNHHLTDHPGAQRGDGDSPAGADGSTEASACPACGQVMAEPDPTALALQRGLETLRAQIENIDGARPARRRALADLDARMETVRTQLRSAQNALTDLERSTRTTEDTGSNTRDFTRGRIDATLSRAFMTDETALEVLRQQQRRAQAVIEALETELDDDTNREQLTSRLFTIGRDMSTYAERLGLEHRSDNVRLDLARLTVVTDAPTGPAPLFRIGSAANAIGYHLAAHLALHRFLTLQDRPVPRLLMLDQPTQAHYPAEADNTSGQPQDDADRVAVRTMFELMRDVVDELAPNFQLIVCDHADLPETWFQAAVRHRWRGGLKLIPTDWLENT